MSEIGKPEETKNPEDRHGDSENSEGYSSLSDDELYELYEAHTDEKEDSSFNELVDIDQIPSIEQGKNEKGRPFIVSEKHKTTNSIGKVLIWSFALIQGGLAIKAIYLAPSVDVLVTYVNSFKEVWGTILGFILGYYFANKE